ncbi:MAG: diguanylate cyclase [Coleofasciculaceae cyanobacterium]
MDVLRFCKKINNYFENNHQTVSFVWGYCLLILISYLDYQIDPQISLSVFYLFPISLITWFISREAGFIVSGLSSVAGFLTKFRDDTLINGMFIPFWNATVMLIVFLTVSSLLIKLRATLKQERIARNDSLTGVANKQLFLELAGMEVKKVHRYRHPLTVVNLDIDDFKLFNQNLGRKLGDKLLYIVAQSLKNSIRETDIIGRIGENEFSIILPGIGYELAHSVICRLRNQLLESMDNQWSVTFSIAAVTFVDPPNSIDEMLHQADHLMYVVKNNGKNCIKHKTATVA